MRKVLIAMGFAAICGFSAVAAPAAAQGFGQVVFGSTTAPPTPPAAGKPAGNDVDGLTVTAKRLPDSQKDPGEVLCHDEIPMGTRFPVKVCAKRGDYADRKQIDDMELRKWTALKR
jgi:hypothetical protein